MNDIPRLKNKPANRGRRFDVKVVEDTPIKIRKLCRKDRCTLTSLITKFVGKTGQHNLTNMVPSLDEATKKDNDQKEMLTFTVQLLTDMVKHIDAEIAPWFADLIGVSVEEFDDLPFDVEVDIIDQLISSTKFVAFFFKVSQVRKKIKDLVIRF